MLCAPCRMDLPLRTPIIVMYNFLLRCNFLPFIFFIFVKRVSATATLGALANLRSSMLT